MEEQNESIPASLTLESTASCALLSPWGQPRMQRSGKRMKEGEHDAGNGFRRRIFDRKNLPGIAGKKVPGCKGIQLFRRPIDNEEVEFVTIMWFDSWDAVKQFAGEDYECAYVPPAAREVLARFDGRSQHYEIKERLD